MISLSYCTFAYYIAISIFEAISQFHINLAKTPRVRNNPTFSQSLHFCNKHTCNIRCTEGYNIKPYYRLGDVPMLSRVLRVTCQIEHHRRRAENLKLETIECQPIKTSQMLKKCKIWHSAEKAGPGPHIESFSPKTAKTEKKCKKLLKSMCFTIEPLNLFLQKSC